MTEIIKADDADRRAHLRHVAGKKPDPNYSYVPQSSMPDVICGKPATHKFDTRFYCARHAKMLRKRQTKYDKKPKEGGDDTPKDSFWTAVTKLKEG